MSVSFLDPPCVVCCKFQVGWPKRQYWISKLTNHIQQNCPVCQMRLVNSYFSIAFCGQPTWWLYRLIPTLKCLVSGPCLCGITAASLPLWSVATNSLPGPSIACLVPDSSQPRTLLVGEGERVVHSCIVFSCLLQAAWFCITPVYKLRAPGDYVSDSGMIPLLLLVVLSYHAQHNIIGVVVVSFPRWMSHSQTPLWRKVF